MLVIPAIDLKDGKCVRLSMGKKEHETVFSDNPVQVAKDWKTQGAEYIHVVDLDGAFDGEPKKQRSFLKILAILRVADALDRRPQGKTRVLSCRLSKTAVHLKIRSRGSSDLELLRLEQKKKLFEQVFKRRVLVTRV